MQALRPAEEPATPTTEELEDMTPTFGVRRWSRIKAGLERESAQRALEAIKKRREAALNQGDKKNVG